MKIMCAGEILYDFISKDHGKGLGETMLFEKRPGGAPFNVAVGLKRLENEVAFLTKIGSDDFGKSLFNILENEKIMTDYVIVEENAKTSLAFAAVNHYGKPEFSFVRDNVADTQLRFEEIPLIRYEEYSAYCFGGISLIDSPSSDSYIKVFENFTKAGVLTAIDPNVRKNLIKDEKVYKDKICYLISKTDIIKLSDDDLFYITDEKDIFDGLMKLKTSRESLVVVTLGKEGALFKFKDMMTLVPGYKNKVVETTGCGDAFMAGLLSNFVGFSRNDLRNISVDYLENAMKYGNAVASIVAGRYGAANAMPFKKEVERFLYNN